VGVTGGSREAPGRKAVTRDNSNNNNKKKKKKKKKNPIVFLLALPTINPGLSLW
jgi:hypothetical protein